MIAKLLEQAHSNPEAAAVLDDWIEERGATTPPLAPGKKHRGRRAVPLSRLILDALVESGDVGLRRRDLVLLAYRSQYPRCSVEEPTRHRAQCGVMIGGLLREWGVQTPDRRWHFKPGRVIGPPYLANARANTGRLRHR